MIWLEYYGHDVSRNSVEGYASLEGETDHSGITITLLEHAQYSVTTDQSDYYYLSGFPDGTYSISASTSGYITETKSDWRFEPAHHQLDFLLNSN